MKRITIEIEISSMLPSDTDYTTEFSAKLQEDLHKTIEKRISRWNRWNSNKMKIDKLFSSIHKTR
jgi:hypothetical protein